MKYNIILISGNKKKIRNIAFPSFEQSQQTTTPSNERLIQAQKNIYADIRR
jgi:hypothetical protein